MNSFYENFQKLVTYFNYIYGLLDIQNTRKGEIVQIYDVNICKIRYSPFVYKIERIKGIIKPICIPTLLYTKIIKDIHQNIVNKKYNIKQLKRNESIVIYIDGSDGEGCELVNNTVNNIIIYNTTMHDDELKMRKIMSN
jgi:hypothetical protein